MGLRLQASAEGHRRLQMVGALIQGYCGFRLGSRTQGRLVPNKGFSLGVRQQSTWFHTNFNMLKSKLRVRVTKLNPTPFTIILCHQNHQRRFELQL